MTATQNAAKELIAAATTTSTAFRPQAGKTLLVIFRKFTKCPILRAPELVPPRAVAAGQSREHAARGVPEYTCCVY